MFVPEKGDHLRKGLDLDIMIFQGRTVSLKMFFGGSNTIPYSIERSEGFDIPKRRTTRPRIVSHHFLGFLLLLVLRSVVV